MITRLSIALAVLAGAGAPAAVAQTAPKPRAESPKDHNVVYSVRQAAVEIGDRMADLTGGRAVVSPCAVGRPSTCRARTTGPAGCRFRIVVHHGDGTYDVFVDSVVCKQRAD